MTVKDAATQTGLSEREIYDQLAPKGKLPCYRFGRRIVIDPADLAAWRESHRCEPKGGRPSVSVSRPALSSSDPDYGLGRHYP